jgi:hypothetical protein
VACLFLGNHERGVLVQLDIVYYIIIVLLSGKIKRFCFEGSLVFSRGTLGIRRLLGDA